MKTKESCHSPFYKLGAFGHIPFEYSGEVYRMNPTVTMVETVLDLINDKEKAFLKSNKPSFSSLPNANPVIVCIVDRIYNQPLGGVEAKESTSLLTDINSIEFHRQYYRHKVKEMYEGFLKVVTGDKAVCPEKLYLNDFFYTLTISFFAEDLLGIKKKVDGQRIGFFKRVLEDVNAFDHIFLSNTLPEDRTQMHFLVWGKVN